MCVWSNSEARSCNHYIIWVCVCSLLVYSMQCACAVLLYVGCLTLQYFSTSSDKRGTVVAQWLRWCATNRKVAGSNPAGIIGNFHWHKILPIAVWPWGRLSLQHKWVPGVFPGGKGGRCVRLTTYYHPVPLSRNLGTLTFWNTLGPSGSVMGLINLFYLIKGRILEQKIIDQAMNFDFLCKFYPKHFSLWDKLGEIRLHNT